MPEPAELVYFRNGGALMSIVEIKKDENGSMENIDVELYEVPNESVSIRQVVYMTDWDILKDFLTKYWKDTLIILSIILCCIGAVIGLCQWHDYLWHTNPEPPVFKSTLVHSVNREFSSGLKQAIKNGDIIPDEIDVTIVEPNVVISDARIRCTVTHRDYTEQELRKFGTKELRDQEASRGYYFYYFDLIGDAE